MYDIHDRLPARSFPAGLPPSLRRCPDHSWSGRARRTRRRTAAGTRCETRRSSPCFCLKTRQASRSAANALVNRAPLIAGLLQEPAARTAAGAPGQRSYTRWPSPRRRGRGRPRSSAAAPLRAAAASRRCAAGTGSRLSHRPRPPAANVADITWAHRKRDRPAARAAPARRTNTCSPAVAGRSPEHVTGELAHHQRRQRQRQRVTGLPLDGTDRAAAPAGIGQAQRDDVAGPPARSSPQAA